MSKQLAKSTLSFASLTMVSRLAGFLRDMILAQVFGAGLGFDAWLIAFKIPNLLRRLFGEGAFSQAFVPVLSEYRERQGDAAVTLFIGRIMGCLGMVLLGLVIVGEFTTSTIVTIFAPGFVHDPQRFQLAVQLLHLTLPYIFFISMTALSAAVLNTYGYFATTAFTPVWLNLCLIAAGWWLAPFFQIPIVSLGWAVLVAGALQFFWQWPILWRLGLWSRPRFTWKDSGVRRVLKLMVPALLGVSVTQLSLLIDGFFASFLPVGSISWLYYSDRLTYLPLGVIGVALATVVLPHLSKQHARGSLQNYTATMDWALLMLFLIGLPAAMGLVVLAGPLLATLIQHGKFTPFDAQMTTRSLTALSLGLPAFMGVKVLASAFYARQDIKTPVKIAVFSIMLNIVLNVLLIKPLAHAGLALATAIASWTNMGLLMGYLFYSKIYRPSLFLSKQLVKIFLITFLMGGVIYYFSPDLTVWLEWTVTKRIFALLGFLLATLFVYVALLALTGWRVKHLSPPREIQS